MFCRSFVIKVSRYQKISWIAKEPNDTNIVKTIQIDGLTADRADGVVPARSVKGVHTVKEVLEVK
jgi:hypothetical protein